MNRDVDLVQDGLLTSPDEVGLDRLPGVLVRTNSDEALIRLWLDAAGAASENTMAAYKAETLRFLAWMRTRSISLDALVYEDLKDFEGWLRNPPAHLVGPRKPIGSPDWRPFASAGLSPASVDRALSVIANLYSFLHDSGRISMNPVKFYRAWQKNARKKDRSQRTRKQLDSSVENAVKQWLDDEEGADITDRWSVGALYFLGLRVSELCSARMSDLFVSDGAWFLAVVGKGLKRRDVAVSKVCLRLLAAYRLEIGLSPEPNGEDWPLVGSKWDPKKPITRRAMHKRIVAAGFDAVFDENSPRGLSANLHPHLYRHAAASRWIRQGANLISVRDQLGHSSVTTTEIYAHRPDAARHADTAGADDIESAKEIGR